MTGSAGHLGEALVRTLRERADDVVGLDVLAVAAHRRRRVRRPTAPPSGRRWPARTPSCTPRRCTSRTWGRTPGRSSSTPTSPARSSLLEEAVDAGVGAFVATSTTSAFGRALTPEDGAPAAWITEDVVPRPRNIYGATKVAAEDLCELVARDHGLPCVVLRTSRFFPEAGRQRAGAQRRTPTPTPRSTSCCTGAIDLADVVGAHLAALDRAAAIGFGRYVVSATTPFGPADLEELHRDAPAVVGRLFPDYAEVYERLGWRMFPRIDRVYVNARARAELGWNPRYDFRHALELLRAGPADRAARSRPASEPRATTR